MAILTKHVLMGKHAAASGSLAGEMKVGAITGSSGLTLNQMLVKLDDNMQAQSSAYIAADAAQLAELRGDCAAGYDDLGKVEDIIIANDAAIRGDVGGSYDTLGKLEDFIIALQADVDQNESDSDAGIAALSSSARVDRALVRTELASEVSTLKGDVAGSYDTLGKLEDYIIALQADVDANEVASDNAESTLSTNLGALSGAVDARFDIIEGSGVGSIAKAVADLVDSAPGALNTLNELAAAINDDAGFHTTITNMVGANETHVDNMATLTGMAKDSTHLGAFSGAVIADNQTVKAALQALETKVEAVQTDVDGNESDADAAIAANEVHIDNAATLSGVAKDAVNLGTFTGQSIGDNRVVKVALQDLETAVEANETEENGRLDKSGGFHVESTGTSWGLGWGSGKPRVAFAIEVDGSVTMSVDRE